jgi:hypothetical protein
MKGTHKTRPGAEETENLFRETPAEDVLRVVADAAVAVFSAEADGNGDDSRQVM